MGKAAYPTAAELSTVLTNAGITVGSLDTQSAVDAARVEFERRVGRRMLAGSSLTRYYAPPANDEGYLDLGRDLVTCTAVKIAYEGASEETLTLDTDYWLLPRNARADTPARPWTGIELARRWWAAAPSDAAMRASWHRAVRVTGTWGYDATIPEDAWLAMLHRAAALVAPQAGSALNDGRTQYTDAGVQTSWGTAPYLELRRTGDMWFEAAVKRYRRMRL